MRELAFLNKGIKITFTDGSAKREKVEEFKFDGGVVQFVEFLDQEPLNKAGFINNDFFFKFLDQAMAKTAERLKQDGKKIGAIDILTTPESRNAFIANLVRSFRQQAPANKKQEYLAEVLNGKLEGSKGSALVNRVLIEDFVENAYYRVRIGRGIDAYVQKLKGK